LSNAIENWAPPVENQTSQYLANVCTWTGLTPDTIIDGYLGQEAPPFPAGHPDCSGPESPDMVTGLL
jgi:hypothetical protein